jgi:hypothetical protein
LKPSPINLPQAEVARKAGDSEGQAKALAAADEALAAAELIRAPEFTEANASAIKGRLLNIANPGAVATTRTKRTDDSGSGNATSGFVQSAGGGTATGPEGGTPPVPGPGGPGAGETIIVTANLAREESTVGRVVVDGLNFAKTKIESFSPLTRELAVGGVRAVLTGGTGPLISVAVNQGAGKALEYVPQSLLKPIAQGLDRINRFVAMAARHSCSARTSPPSQATIATQPAQTAAPPRSASPPCSASHSPPSLAKQRRCLSGVGPMPLIPTITIMATPQMLQTGHG